MSVFLPRLGSAAAAELEPARAAAQAGPAPSSWWRTKAGRAQHGRAGPAPLGLRGAGGLQRRGGSAGRGQERPGSIQLVLTDIVMPQMDGKAFEEFTCLNPGVCVLFMSGYIGESMLRKQALDPDRNFLQSPSRPRVSSARGALAPLRNLAAVGS